MKKLLLTAILCITALISNAQTKTIDWSFLSIDKPTQLNSANTSTQFNCDFVFKNLGPDSAIKGDTILAQFAFTVGNQTFVWPSPTELSYQLAKKTYKTNDTMHFVTSFSFPGSLNFSSNIQFNGITYLWSAKRGVARENTAGIVNNRINKSITWFNPQGWAVSTKNATLNGFELSPNPAASNLKINLLISTQNTQIAIYNVQGQAVKSVELQNGASNADVNIADLKTGIYMVQVIQGNQTYTQKLVKN